MILLWGIPGEGPFDAVRAVLAELRQPVIVFDQRMVRDWSIELSVGAHHQRTTDPTPSPAGRLIGPAGTIDLAAITAVYARPYDPVAVPAIAGEHPASHAVDHARQVHEALRIWCEVTPAHVVNRASAMASNNSKPYQAALIQAATDLRVPPTLVTTDPDAARRFIAEHADVIYKSVSAIRSVVGRVTPARAAALDDVATCPTQFQAYIAGTDVRVHVVGDEVFGCEIASTAVDYRYPSDAAVATRPYTVPGAIAERCRTLTRALDLVVAGIDLRRTDAGDWYCFEVNPSPAFAFFDHDGGIAHAVARQLASGGRS